MTFAAILALLLVLATSLPSPAPNAPAVRTPTLTFADGLQRLINDGSNVPPQYLVFAPDLGPRIGGSDNRYALKFAVAGFTDCEVISNGYDAGDVACSAYKGPDAAVARTTFSHLLRQLQDFAGRNSVSVIKNPPHIGLHVGKETEATYLPNGHVRLFIHLLESTVESFPSAVSLVVFHVPANETSPAPTPSVNPCPTKGVLRITRTGLIPSARNPKNSPPPTTGPQVQTTNDWVMILVEVNPNGSVKGIKLLHSGGPAYNSRILHKARTSRYQPKMVDCKAVEGIYYLFAPIGNT